MEGLQTPFWPGSDNFAVRGIRNNIFTKHLAFLLNNQQENHVYGRKILHQHNLRLMVLKESFKPFEETDDAIDFFMLLDLSEDTTPQSHILAHLQIGVGWNTSSSSQIILSSMKYSVTKESPQLIGEISSCRSAIYETNRPEKNFHEAPPIYHVPSPSKSQSEQWKAPQIEGSWYGPKGEWLGPTTKWAWTYYC